MDGTQKKLSELNELKSTDLDKVFGGESQVTDPDYGSRVEDEDRTIPTDPSKRKKKRLSGL